MKKEYKIIGRFSCCGIDMVVVKINGAASVMSKREFNRIIENERKFLYKRKAA